jgi:hypothetical protein
MSERVTFTEFLDNLVDACQDNVDEYEGFYEGHLADIRRLDSMDAFMYGLASGKLDMAISLRDLITELLVRYGDEG